MSHPDTILPQIYSHIDSNIEKHIERIKEICRIPGIAANNPEGIQKTTELIQKWFEDLGCIETEVVKIEGPPVVYGYYDSGSKNTLNVYMMYDVKQVTGENWTMIKDPFDPQLMAMSPFKQVLVGRGTINSKGPMTAFLNSLFSIKEIGEELPVNLKFIAEGEEELGSEHLMQFIKKYEHKLKSADACFSASGLAASQNIDGVPIVHLGRKGTIELELECSGEYWNRGPTKRGIHSSLYAIVESPIWRLIQALSTMVDKNDPSKVIIKGFYDNVAPPTSRDLELIDELAKTFDENSIKKANEVKHFVHDLHGKDLLIKAFYTTTLNVQGIYGGYTGPKGKTVLPHNVKVKLESRLIPNQNRNETVTNIRTHLDKHGYQDIKIVDGRWTNSNDWSRTDPDSGLVKVVTESYEKWGFKPEIWPYSLGSAPFYIWTKYLKMPILSAGLGYGGRAHAPDEYYVIENDSKQSKVAGLADAEKFYAYMLYQMKNRTLR